MDIFGDKNLHIEVYKPEISLSDISILHWEKMIWDLPSLFLFLFHRYQVCSTSSNTYVLQNVDLEQQQQTLLSDRVVSTEFTIRNLPNQDPDSAFLT